MMGKLATISTGPERTALAGLAGLLVLSLLVLAGDARQRADHVPPSEADGQHSARALLSVRDFGARGDGTSDDRPAIQTALDAAYARGATLRFPSGTYLLRSSTQPRDRILRTYPDQRIVGDGRTATVLRIAPNFGPYVTVLGAASDRVDIATWSLADLTIDQNAEAGNQVDVATIAWLPQMAVRLGSYREGSRVEVSHCGLRNSSSLNGLYLFARDVVVTSCLFAGIGGRPNSPVHDHSTVYTASSIEAGTQKITDNKFIGVQASGGARSAIDTHGGYQVVRGNEVTGYLRGFNITGMARVPTRSAVIDGNKVYGAAVGIEVWVRKRERAHSAIELQQVLVRGNQLWLASVASRPPSLRLEVRAVVTNPGNDQPVERMVIQSNVFRTLGPTGSGDPVGIDCVSQHDVSGVSSIAIMDNQFQGRWAALIAQPCFRAQASITRNEVRP